MLCANCDVFVPSPRYLSSSREEKVGILAKALLGLIVFDRYPESYGRDILKMTSDIQTPATTGEDARQEILATTRLGVCIGTCLEPVGLL